MSERSDSDTPKEAPRRHLVDGLFAPWLKEAEAESINWQQDAHRAYLEQHPLRARSLLYVVGIIVVALVVWAGFAEVDEVTRGTGKVIPSQQVQVIQSQDGGVIREILVREGDIVARDQLLLRLDQTRSEATLRENQAEKRALELRAARLQAIIDREPFEPPMALADALPGIVAQEIALYQSSLRELELEQQIAEDQLTQRREELSEVNAKESQAARSLELTEQELNRTRPMVASGAVSEVEILRLERQVNQLQGERDQARAQRQRILAAISEAERHLQEVEIEFLNENREELTETLSRINALEEAGAGLSDRVAQTSLRSPVNGTVKQLHYNTIGGVVLPGKEIIEIVPLDDTLLLEVRVRPKDIAFLVPGQEALVKFTAYDFVVYGGLRGKVEQIGADTVVDEEGNPYYEIRVRTDEPSLDDDKPIIPGMTVEVDILTGKKTILAYLLKPVLRAKQYALSER
jgi:adhesin transport system membrane fusion protein